MSIRAHIRWPAVFPALAAGLTAAAIRGAFDLSRARSLEADLRQRVPESREVWSRTFGRILERVADDPPLLADGDRLRGYPGPGRQADLGRALRRGRSHRVPATRFLPGSVGRRAWSGKLARRSRRAACSLGAAPGHVGPPPLAERCRPTARVGIRFARAAQGPHGARRPRPGARECTPIRGLAQRVAGRLPPWRHLVPRRRDRSTAPGAPRGLVSGRAVDRREGYAGWPAHGRDARMRGNGLRPDDAARAPGPGSRAREERTRRIRDRARAQTALREGRHEVE
jgi:hypothetical protein